MWPDRAKVLLIVFARNVYESQTYITAGLLASGCITQRVETLPFHVRPIPSWRRTTTSRRLRLCPRQRWGSKEILSTVSVYKVLMKVITVSGLRRHRSFENSTENSDRNSSVSCLFDSAVCTPRLQVVKIFAIVTAGVTIWLGQDYKETKRRKIRLFSYFRSELHFEKKLLRIN